MFGSMAQRKTLLVVDDNEELRGAIAEQLQLSEDFSAIEAATAGDGVKAAVENRPDLILLDVDLPDMNGREACRQMRAKGVVAPIIMLTAAAADDDQISGLEAGANDYVTKPFSLAVLRARVAARTLQGTLWFFTYRFSLLPLAVTLPCFAALGALLPPAFYRAAARRSLVERLRQAE